MKAIGRAVIIAAISASLTVCTGAPSGANNTPEPRRAARLMPPGTLECSRNDLTSYTGRVTRYQRTPDKTTVAIETDADTTEEVVVHHANATDAFLLNGAPFTADDWQKIESQEGTLRPEMRVTAWVCLDGKTSPVLDWRPG